MTAASVTLPKAPCQFPQTDMLTYHREVREGNFGGGGVAGADQTIKTLVQG